MISADRISSVRQVTARLSTATAALLFLTASAIAAGDGGGSGGGGSSGGGSGSSGGGSGSSGGGGPADTQCYNGKVYDKKKRMCVSPQAQLDDGSLIDHAYMLARDGKANEALTFLARVDEITDPYFLNIKGFATRKAGDVDKGIVYYKQALAIDKDNALVREYLGEAYITKGEVALARAELDEIARICGGTECEEYRDLSAEIVKAGGKI